MKITPEHQILRTLLDGVIDYAGLFPPASLDLDTSIRNFVSYLGDDDSWMLRSFVCPASRLGNLATYVDLLATRRDVAVTVLAPAAPDLDSWRSACGRTMERAQEFVGSTGGVAAVPSFEMKLPATLASSAGDLKAGLEHLLGVAAEFPDADFFIEIVPSSPKPESVAAAVRSLADRNPHPGLGLKIRTGGVTPPEVPPASAVAQFICACRDHGVRFKATAGLHHPLRHFSPEVGAEMHGFLNVFAAAVMADAHGLDAATVADLLLVTDPAALRWTHDGITFGQYEAAPDDVRRARRSLAVSFGSCSFDDPRQDLVGLGLATYVE